MKGIMEDMTEMANISLENLEEFQKMLQLWNVPKNWHQIADSNEIILFKLRKSPGPVITYSITISSDMELKTFLSGTEIFLRTNKFRAPFKLKVFNDLTRLVYEIERLENLHDHELNSKQHSTNQICNMLESLESDHNNFFFPIVCEQLRLSNIPRHKHTYSSENLIFYSFLNTISASAYNYLNNHIFRNMPNTEILESICNTNPMYTAWRNERKFLLHAKKSFTHLRDYEKFVILEFHIKPFEYSNSKNVGIIYPGDAHSAHIFMISSIASNFREVIHITPRTRNNHDMLYNAINTILVDLETIGYKVFCVMSNNNTICNDAMCNFSPNKKLNFVFPHPCDNSRPLFYVYNSIYLFRRIMKNWINPQTEEMLTYPDFDDLGLKYASFEGLRILNQKNSRSQLKSYPPLKLLSIISAPSIESGELMLNVMNSLINEDPQQHEADIEHFKDTTDFLRILLIWWETINAKIYNEGRGESPVHMNISDKESEIEILMRMLEWLEVWKNSNKYKIKLSPKTHVALYHSIHGLLEIIKYCFVEIDLDYVSLKKFQMGDLGNEFGIYHKLNKKNKIIIQSLMSLRSEFYGNIDIKYFHERDNDDNFTESIDKDHLESDWFVPDFSSIEGDVENANYEMPAIIYLAAYCCHVLFKKIRCKLCKSILTNDNDLLVEDHQNLIEISTKAILKYPKKEVINMVLYAYLMFNKILKEHEQSFLNILNKRRFLSTIILRLVLEKDLLKNVFKCETHSNKYLSEVVINLITDTLLKNYCGKNNEGLRRGKKRKRKN